MRSRTLSTVVSVTLQLLGLFFALVPGALGPMMPVRVVVAGMLVAILPGILVSTALRHRSRHVLESIALGALGSTSVVAAIGLITMTAGWPIAYSVALLFVVNALLTCRVLLLRRSSMPAMRTISDWLLLLCLAFFATIAFRWGDDIRAVGWEVALHVAYVRQYASGLPLDFQTAVLRPPDVVAQNYFYLWEYLLAMIASIAGIDPMVAALKARWLIPVLGFASFAFMVQRLTNTGAAVRATWVMVAAVFLQFLTLPPNPYDIYIQSGPLRQVGAFFGSIHHSDSAMEILLPLLIGVLFTAIRRNNLTNWSIFAIALVVAFLWHPREYFQVMWYGGVAIVVDVLTGVGRRLSWRERGGAYASMVGVYILVAGVLYLGIPGSIRESSEHAVGMARQWTDLKQFVATAGEWRAWTAGSLPMSTHLHGYELRDLAAGPPLAFSWYVLSVLATGLLVLSPRRSFRRVAFYLLVLWLMSLCSSKFQELLQAITYHEILISKPRLIHLFAYAAIGLGWSELLRGAAGRFDGTAATARTFGAALISGALFALAWRTSTPSFTTMFLVLNVLFFAIAAALLWSLRVQRWRQWSGEWRPPAVMAGLTFAMFALPASAASAMTRWPAMLEHRLDAATLFGPGNPVELAPDTIAYLQTKLPPHQRVLVEPNRPYMIGVYTPAYVTPLLGNIGADMAELGAGLNGTHPVFAKSKASDPAALEAARLHLRSQRIEHLLGTGDYADVFRSWVDRDPVTFSIEFESANHSNVMVAVHLSQSIK